MRITLLAAGLLITAAAAACKESTAPHVRIYELTEVDGHPLPVTFGGIDASTTLLGSRLFLDDQGRAMRTEQNRQYSANNGKSTNWSSQRYQEYRITGDSISLGTYVVCSGQCETTDVGAFSGSTVTLTIDVTPRTSPVYTYRLASAF